MGVVGANCVAEVGERAIVPGRGTLGSGVVHNAGAPMLDGLGECQAVLGCRGEVRAVLGGLGECQAVLGRLGECRAVLSGLGECQAVLGDGRDALQTAKG